jgi:hypothetical protein
MSLEVIIREKLEQLLIKLNDDLSTGNNSVDEYEMFELFEKLEDDSYGKYIDQIQNSQPCNETLLMSEFYSFNDEKKRLLVLVMDLVSKMGKIHNHSDNSKQIMWFEKLKSWFPQY